MSVLLLVCVLFGVGLCATIPSASVTPWHQYSHSEYYETLPLVTTPDTRPGCIYNGYHISPGEYHGFDGTHTLCKPLVCDASGSVFTTYIDCNVQYCVDPVYRPGRCCSHSCDNGENCLYQDGIIIKMGEVYQPDANTTCSCPRPWGFGSVQKVLAICETKWSSSTMLPIVG